MPSIQEAGVATQRVVLVDAFPLQGEERRLSDSLRKLYGFHALGSGENNGFRCNRPGPREWHHFAGCAHDFRSRKTV